MGRKTEGSSAKTALFLPKVSGKQTDRLGCTHTHTPSARLTIRALVWIRYESTTNALIHPRMVGVYDWAHLSLLAVPCFLCLVRFVWIMVAINVK